jgi:thioredoxin-like negative regulator of GroEL
MAKNYQGRIKFGKVNTEKNKGLLKRYDIDSFPHIKVFEWGKNKNDLEAWNYDKERDLPKMI